MMELLLSPAAWSAFLTLTAIELVLGIDNIVFISVLADRLPEDRRESARLIGLFFAMFVRIALLFMLVWLIGLTHPLFSLFGNEISARDLILIVGGLFLLWKSTSEIHNLLEGEHDSGKARATISFTSVVAQIILLDIVFSIDSIVTAIGLVKDIVIMVSAVVTSVVLMMLFANPIGRFVSKHPTIKMLALSFLCVIGVLLIAEGFGHHVPKGYIYFAMAFSVVVEMLNLRLRQRSATPVEFHQRYTPVVSPGSDKAEPPGEK